MANEISTAIEFCSQSNQDLPDEIVTKAREVYLKIINTISDFDDKRSVIYNLTALPEIDGDLENNEFKLSYCMGLNPTIKYLQCNKYLTVGRIEQNDIVYHQCGVSRLHMFIFSQNDKILVVDPHSKYRTRDNGVEKSLHTYNKGQQFTLSFGSPSSHITFNPRPCIACTDSKCEVRADCGHSVFCMKCDSLFREGANNTAECPICRKIGNRHVSQCRATFQY